MNCKNIIASNENNGLNKCYCKSGYRWVSDAQSIEGISGCQINCTSISYTNSNQNLIACKCLPGYTWFSD
jgi:hypothetical protein